MPVGENAITGVLICPCLRLFPLCTSSFWRSPSQLRACIRHIARTSFLNQISSAFVTFASMLFTKNKHERPDLMRRGELLNPYVRSDAAAKV
ncbi:hypothetical protein Y032_0102g3452 [Ancylostoma ceylanicum]|uniref:Uncharacterized protein n=1 Tax=Ancylostoma ceylanicum TaxID=53326 RepID=A0A016TH89_9BILA|nr:hypothetical protein Y032_0102g3452 [Ancylostoma ceylanicum]